MIDLNQIALLFARISRAEVYCSVIVLLIFTLFFSACSFPGDEPLPGGRPIPSMHTPTPAVELSDDELKRLVDSCWCREASESNFVQILSVNKSRLVNLLNDWAGAVTRGKSTDSPEVNARVLKYFYLLAWLGEDYEGNTKRLVRLTASDAHIRADAIGYLGVLIKKGDKSLLRDVFAFSTDSDAGISTEILEILRVELSESPGDVLRILAKETEPVQAAVISLIANVDETNKPKIRRSISAVKKDNTSIQKVADDFLRVLQ